MMARTLLRTTALVLCAFVFGASISLAQTNAFQRISIVEEFTSATCPPCVAADPVLADVCKLENGVVSVRYHMNWPAPNDPFHDANVTENQARRSFYGVNSIPYARVNGKSQVSPTSKQALLNQISADAGVMAPCKITIKQQGGEVEVTVQTSADVTDATLHVAVINRHVSLPNLPNTLANSNGQDEFADAMMKMLPNQSGTPINLGGNTTETYRFPASLGAGELWPDDQATVVAFIQKNSGNQEIVQAGAMTDPNDAKKWATLKATSVQVTGDQPMFDKIDQGATKNRTLTIKNNGSTASTVTLSIANPAVLTALGWSAEITPNVVDVTPGQTVTATLALTVPSENPIFAPVEVAVSATDGMGKAVEPMYFLVNGARVVVYSGFSDDSYQLISTALRSTQFSNEFVTLPFASQILTAYPPTDFDAIVLAQDFWNLPMTQVYGDFAQQAVAAGKHVWMANDIVGSLFVNPQNGLSDEMNWMRNTLGLDVAQIIQRVTTNTSGQITGITQFPVTGVAGDLLDGFQLTANRYDQTAWPYFQVYSDAMKTMPGSKAKPFLYYDAIPANVGGYRIELPAKNRVVWTTLVTEAIRTLADRVEYTDAIVDYLLNGREDDPVSVETETVSATGAIALELTGVNPVVDMTSFNVTSNGVAPITVSVVDVLGRTVGTLHNGVVNGTTNVNMDAAALGNGTYSIVASNGTESTTITVVVAK